MMVMVSMKTKRPKVKRGTLMRRLPLRRGRKPQTNLLKWLSQPTAMSLNNNSDQRQPRLKGFGLKLLKMLEQIKATRSKRVEQIQPPNMKGSLGGGLGG